MKKNKELSSFRDPSGYIYYEKGLIGNKKSKSNSSETSDQITEKNTVFANFISFLPIIICTSTLIQLIKFVSFK